MYITNQKIIAFSGLICFLMINCFAIITFIDCKNNLRSLNENSFDPLSKSVSALQKSTLEFKELTLQFSIVRNQFYSIGNTSFSNINTEN
jgi:hypothetical protein